jgi:hypothetical protein
MSGRGEVTGGVEGGAGVHAFAFKCTNLALTVNNGNLTRRPSCHSCLRKSLIISLASWINLVYYAAAHSSAEPSVLKPGVCLSAMSSLTTTTQIRSGISPKSLPRTPRWAVTFRERTYGSTAVLTTVVKESLMAALDSHRPTTIWKAVSKPATSRNSKSTRPSSPATIYAYFCAHAHVQLGSRHAGPCHLLCSINHPPG